MNIKHIIKILFYDGFFLYFVHDIEYLFNILYFNFKIYIDYKFIKYVNKILNYLLYTL